MIFSDPDENRRSKAAIDQDQGRDSASGPAAAVAQPADPKRVEDLTALRDMVIYVRNELLRLDSAGFWPIAAVPELLEDEIADATGLSRRRPKSRN
jgi:hypothetical protein